MACNRATLRRSALESDDGDKKKRGGGGGGGRRVSGDGTVDATTLLFVYGTLKRGFHWHSKFMSDCTFVSVGTTSLPLPLVVGDSGVPYVLGDMPEGVGECVVGEVFSVPSESLENLDEYEGVGKGYYRRATVLVDVPTPSSGDDEGHGEGHGSGTSDGSDSLGSANSGSGCVSGSGSAGSCIGSGRGGGSAADCDSRSHQVPCQVYVKVASDSTPWLRQGPFLREYTMAMHHALYLPIRHIQAKQLPYLALANDLS
jgi:gamma-glutamylcyclotransferase (GGCT)/AIG2-like uncharacterized protein YtfP